MILFGRIVQSVKGRKELYDGIIDYSCSGFDLKDGREVELVCSVIQNVKLCQVNNKFFVRFVIENDDNDDDDVYDDEYVLDESEFKYSWYEDEDEEGIERVLIKVGK